MTFDYVNTQPCGCKITFRAKDAGKSYLYEPCKKHKEGGVEDRMRVIDRAEGQLRELKGEDSNG